MYGIIYIYIHIFIYYIISTTARRNRVEIHPIQNNSSSSISQGGTFCTDSTIYFFDHYHMKRTMELDKRSAKDCILWINNNNASGENEILSAEEKHLQLCKLKTCSQVISEEHQLFKVWLLIKLALIN